MGAISIATWNAGNGSELDFFNLLERCDVLAGCEFGDRRAWLKEADRRGFQALPGNLPGSASTPLIVSPRVRVRRTITLPMLDSHFIGSGAGPSHNKPKTANGALLSKGDTTFGVIATHLVASQGKDLRRRAAIDHVDHLADAFTHRHFPWFLCGDFNGTPDSDVFRQLYRSGWTNNHRADRERVTHGNRAIDYVWWLRDPTRIHLTGTRTVSNRSDHDALFASFEIHRKGKR